MVPVIITEEFSEDMLMAYMPTLIQEVIPGAMAEGLESMLINGDSEGTHQDNGITNDDVESITDGLRKIAIAAGATVDLSTYNFSSFSKVLRKGGKWTVKPRDGAWIMSNSAYTQCIDFDQVKTLDKMSMPTNFTKTLRVLSTSFRVVLCWFLVSCMKTWILTVLCLIRMPITLRLEYSTSTADSSEPGIVVRKASLWNSISCYASGTSSRRVAKISKRWKTVRIPMIPLEPIIRLLSSGGISLPLHKERQ